MAPYWLIPSPWPHPPPLTAMSAPASLTDWEVANGCWAPPAGRHAAASARGARDRGDEPERGRESEHGDEESPVTTWRWRCSHGASVRMRRRTAGTAAAGASHVAGLEPQRLTLVHNVNAATARITPGPARGFQAAP